MAGGSLRGGDDLYESATYGPFVSLWSDLYPTSEWHGEARLCQEPLPAAGNSRHGDGGLLIKVCRHRLLATPLAAV